MTDPNTIPRALEWVAQAEADVLDAYRGSIVETYGRKHPVVKAVLPAINERRVELMRQQQRRRGCWTS